MANIVQESKERNVKRLLRSEDILGNEPRAQARGFRIYAQGVLEAIMAGTRKHEQHITELGYESETLEQRVGNNTGDWPNIYVLTRRYTNISLMIHNNNPHRTIIIKKKKSHWEVATSSMLLR